RNLFACRNYPSDEGFNKARVLMPLEARQMRSFNSNGTMRRLLTAVALFSLIFVAAGCDEYVQITRDRDTHIPKNATWAWRPVVEEAAVARDNRGTNNPTADNRAVISRDEPARNQPVRRGPDPNDELVRGRVKTAIEQTLASKGFKQVSDP